MPTGPTKCLDPQRTPSIEERLDEILQELHSLKTAFPNGPEGEADLIGHRRYHEAKIAAAEAEKAFWQELKLDLAKKGAWGILLIIVGLIVAGLMAKLGLGGGVR